jgi:anti-sigma B factor antagonist
MLAGVEAAEAAGSLDGTRVVELPAEIDHDSADQAQAALTGALAAGVTVLVADMTATTYCTLEGVRALLRAHRAAQAAGAHLRLAGVAPAVQRILEITGTSKVLSIDPGLDAARDGQARPGTGMTCEDTPARA